MSATTMQIWCKTCGEDYTLSWKETSSPSDIAMGIEIVMTQRLCDVCDEINWKLK